MRWVVVAVLLAGCATRTVVVAPSMVAANARELRSEGDTTIYTMDGQRAELHSDDKVEVYVREDGDLQKKVRLTLGELASGCEDPASPSCVANRVVDQRLVIRHEHSLDKDGVAKGVGFLSIGGVIGYCLAECQDESTVPRALAYTGLAIGAAALLFLVMAYSGH